MCNYYHLIIIRWTQTWAYVLAGNRHLAERIGDIDVDALRQQPPLYQAVVRAKCQVV